jgi:hypothetical protein
MDDFAIRDGVVWAPTHISNTVLKISLATQRSADVLDASHGAIGPASVSFGTSDKDKDTLYIVTDGNLFGNQFAMNGEPVVAPVLLKMSTQGL